MDNVKTPKLSLRGCFIIAAALFAAFVALIIMLLTVDKGTVYFNTVGGIAKTEVGLSHLNESVCRGIGYSTFCYTLSEIFGVLCLLIAGGFAVFGVFQLATRKSLKRVDKKIYLLAAFYVLVAVLYVFFEIVIINYRPAHASAEKEASFPSSHTVLSLCVCLSAASVIGDYIKNEKLLLSVKIALYSLGALTALFRMLSGVHWFTDIIGGVLLPFALWFAFKGTLRLIDNKQS